LYIKFIYEIAIRFQLWLSIMLSIFAKRCIWERKTIKLFRPRLVQNNVFDESLKNLSTKLKTLLHVSSKARFKQSGS